MKRFLVDYIDCGGPERGASETRSLPCERLTIFQVH